MSILPSPSFSGSSPTAALSLSPHAGKHPACGRKKAALPLILFQILAVLFLICGTVAGQAQEKGQCSDGSTWELIDDTLFIRNDNDSYVELYDIRCGWRGYSFSSVVIDEGVASIGSSVFEKILTIDP